MSDEKDGIFISYMENSQTAWGTTFKKDVNKWPGHEALQTGALQRIAKATEAMSVNYTRLQEDLDWYKKQYESERATNKKQEHRIRALKGVITKLKKKK